MLFYKHCANCGKQIPLGRRDFCSDSCYSEYIGGCNGSVPVYGASVEEANERMR